MPTNAFVVHAKDADTAASYRRYSFLPFLDDEILFYQPMTVISSLPQSITSQYDAVLMLWRAENCSKPVPLGQPRETHGESRGFFVI